jgi:hypothetical protein
VQICRLVHKSSNVLFGRQRRKEPVAIPRQLPLLSLQKLLPCDELCVVAAQFRVERLDPVAIGCVKNLFDQADSLPQPL